MVQTKSFLIILHMFSGGAFYTPETIDTARLHYRSSWAPVLHAVALWLSSTGFGVGEDKIEVASAPSKAPALTQGASFSTNTCEESVEDRMHLMLGKETSFVVYRMNVVVVSRKPVVMYQDFFGSIQRECVIFLKT